jgi:hypothetical protein
LAAATSSQVDAVCTEGVWTGKRITVNLLKSTNGGSTFGPGHLLPFNSVGAAAATGPSTVAVGATVPHTTTDDDTLEMSFDGGTSWQLVYSHPGDGWLELGFTTLDQGVAIASAPPDQRNTMLFTTDGGRHWAPVSF